MITLEHLSKVDLLEEALGTSSQTIKQVANNPNIRTIQAQPREGESATINQYWLCNLCRSTTGPLDE